MTLRRRDNEADATEACAGEIRSQIKGKNSLSNYTMSALPPCVHRSPPDSSSFEVPSCVSCTHRRTHTTRTNAVLHTYTYVYTHVHISAHTSARDTQNGGRRLPCEQQQAAAFYPPGSRRRVLVLFSSSPASSRRWIILLRSWKRKPDGCGIYRVESVITSSHLVPILNGAT